MNSESTWNAVFDRVMQAARCAIGATLLPVSSLDEQAREETQQCATCTSEAHKQCAGCDEYFCLSCFETHKQVSADYLNAAREQEA